MKRESGKEESQGALLIFPDTWLTFQPFLQALNAQASTSSQHLLWNQSCNCKFLLFSLKRKYSSSCKESFLKDLEPTPWNRKYQEKWGTCRLPSSWRTEALEHYKNAKEWMPISWPPPASFSLTLLPFVSVELSLFPVTIIWISTEIFSNKVFLAWLIPFSAIFLWQKDEGHQKKRKKKNPHQQYPDFILDRWK